MSLDVIRIAESFTPVRTIPSMHSGVHVCIPEWYQEHVMVEMWGHAKPFTLVNPCMHTCYGHMSYIHALSACCFIPAVHTRHTCMPYVHAEHVLDCASRLSWAQPQPLDVFRRNACRNGESTMLPLFMLCPQRCILAGPIQIKKHPSLKLVHVSMNAWQ